MPRRIVLFTRDAGLTVALRTLLPIEDRVQQFEAPDGRPGELDPAADTLVLDLPAELRKGAYRSIREWFPGRVVVLLVPGEQDRSFDGDQACRVLFRPFQLDDLIRELVVPPAAARRRGAAPSGPSRRAGGQSAAAPPGPAAGDLPVRPRAAAASPPPPSTPAQPRTGAPPPAGAAAPPPPGPDASRPGAPSPPPSPDASRARFPGGVDRPSRTASPGAPEKVRPDEPDATAEPAAPPPPLFDWFASHGRRVDEAVADPPANGTPGPTGRAPSPPPAPGQPPRPAQGPAAIPDLGRPTEPWRPLVPTEEPPAATGPGRPADPRRPPGSTERPNAAAGSGPPADSSPPSTDLRRPAAAKAEQPVAKDPGRRVDPGRPPGTAEGLPAAPAPGPPMDLRRPSGSPEGPPGASGPGRPAEQRRPLTELRRAADSAEASPAAAGPRTGDQPAVSRPPDRQPGVAAERGRDQPAGSAAVGEEPPKQVVDLRTGLPRRRAGGRSGSVVDVERAAAAAEPVRAMPAVGTPSPGAVRAAAGQPGERVRAPAAEGWAGPAPAFARLLVAVLLGSLAVLVSGLFSTRSPEIGAGEAAIAQIARSAASGTGLAWHGQPVLDQPPLALAAHAGWLLASGRGNDELVQTVQQARLSSSGFRGLATALLVLLVFALTERRRDTLLRFAVAAAAGLVAALDPVLAGAGRVLTVESVGLAAGLAVLLLAWLLQERSAAAFVPVVGLASGVALLADGRSLVLLLVPLGFALAARGWDEVAGLAGKALAALAVGLGFWGAFAAWVVRAPGAAGLGQRLERLAALAHLTGSDRPLPLSRPLELTLPRDLATVAVLVLAVPALVAVWRRGERAGRFLAAWNLTGLAAGVLLAAVGALDESWLAYLVPGAVAAVALGLGAFRDLLAGQGAWARRVATVTVSVAVLALVVLGGRGWEGRYGRADNALAQMATLVATKTPTCSALNGGDPADPDLFAVGTRRVTGFADGPAALGSGVRYFLLRGDQAAGGLAAWLGANGRRVASVPSPSLGSVQLWEVQQPSSSRVADLQRVGGGVFENATGSACGGFVVVDGGGARFWSGYQAIGGKAVAGRALSRPWRDGGRTVQAFDTMFLGSVPDPQGGQPLARPVALLTRLTRQAPALLAGAQLPKAETAPPPSIAQRRLLLAEPSIARFYLGEEPAAANPAVWQLAAARFGAPVSPPRHLPGGLVRQAFEDVVMEADAQGAVQLAPLGALAARARMIPAEALRPEPVPGLPPPGGRYPAVRDLGLGLHLAAALVLWALLALALAVGGRLRRGSTPALVMPGLALSWPESPERSAAGLRRPTAGPGSSAADPGRPAAGPPRSTDDPGPPAAGPGRSALDPGNHAAADDPGRPGADPDHLAAGPRRSGDDPERPAADPRRSGGDPVRPAADPGRPASGPGRPAAGPERAGHGPTPGTAGEEPAT